MSVVTETIEVDAPVRAVYNQWTQFEDFPQFMEGVDSIVQQADDRTHWKINIGGVEREFDAMIIEQVPDERVAWASVSGPRHAGLITFEPQSADRTSVTARINMEPEGITEKVGDALGLITRRVRGDLERFKEFLEARGSESGGWRGKIS
ncbi:SRPBCC family protein [Longispora fulva]|uniref:Putative membrane protein n=1 Tax=Longispora fulva TaxID=619741 RepID=A0A8J7G722_9ACTN|nr:SRPBCC family protein [Longispora fulva]MBG6134065.1 putative membrane protein [Longispora fulva]